MFCQKCGAILVPKKEGNKKILSCSCGYKSKEIGDATIREDKKAKAEEIEVVDHGRLETMPKTSDVECSKCGNKEAYFWLVQTRASDEPETKFLKCTKCGHIWRDYG